MNYELATQFSRTACSRHVSLSLSIPICLSLSHWSPTRSRYLPQGPPPSKRERERDREREEGRGGGGREREGGRGRKRERQGWRESDRVRWLHLLEMRRVEGGCGFSPPLSHPPERGGGRERGSVLPGREREARCCQRGKERERRKALNRGTSLIRNHHPVGSYSRTMPRHLWRSWGGGAVDDGRDTPVLFPSGLRGRACLDPRQFRTQTFTRSVSHIRFIYCSFVVQECIVPHGKRSNSQNLWRVSRVELSLPVDCEVTGNSDRLCSKPMDCVVNRKLYR